MITEIVVGTSKLALPEPWRWSQSKSGTWSAVNAVIEVIVSADVRGDDGLQVLVETLAPTHIPAVVLALVVLANDGGTIQNMFAKMTRYVTRMPEIEEIHDAD